MIVPDCEETRGRETLQLSCQGLQEWIRSRGCSDCHICFTFDKLLFQWWTELTPQIVSVPSF